MRFAPSAPFDPAKDGWACWDHIGVTGWPDCYDAADPNTCEYDPWGDQLPYEDMVQVRDTVSHYYPECSYNTYSYRMLGAEVTRGHLYVTELRLYKYDGFGGREFVDNRFDTWDVR